VLRPGAASVGADLEAVGVCGAVPVPPVALKLQHVDARQGLESLPETALRAFLAIPVDVKGCRMPLII